MKIVLCTKTVVMDLTEEVTFTKGKKYKVVRDGRYIEALNNQGEVHGIGGMYAKDFFKEHFEVVK